MMRFSIDLHRVNDAGGQRRDLDARAARTSLAAAFARLASMEPDFFQPDQPLKSVAACALT
jgi:hypothetical protein